MIRVTNSIKTDRNVSLSTQKKVRQSASFLIGKIVVVRTLFGTFIGCLRSVSSTFIHLRIFNGFKFITISIPIIIIFAILRFPCP